MSLDNNNTFYFRQTMSSNFPHVRHKIYMTFFNVVDNTVLIIMLNITILITARFLN